jgi:SAM-dependent methyltransferase
MFTHPKFGQTSEDYARHRAGFPDSLFERLAAYGVGKRNQSIVDLGTGTGSLARGFASRGCNVTGIDPAEEMLAEACKLDVIAEVQIEYRIAKAENTQLPDASFDIVTAGQCWHWFDRPKVAAEVKRMLKPNGIVVIAHFDWIPLAGNLVRATEELIEQRNPDWNMGGGSGMYPLWLKDLSEAGFKNIESFSYDLDVPYTHEAWRGRIRASAGVGNNMSSTEVKEFDEELGALLDKRFPERILSVPHRVFAVIGDG